jgi:hypothetical protein
MIDLTLAEATLVETSINPFEILLFAVGVLFTLALLGVFIFILTRKETGQDENPS